MLDVSEIERVDEDSGAVLRQDALQRAKQTIAAMSDKLKELTADAHRAQRDRTVALAEDLLRLVVNYSGGFPGKPGEAARECARQTAALHAECARIAARGAGGQEAVEPEPSAPDAPDADLADPADDQHAAYRPDADAELWGLE